MNEATKKQAIHFGIWTILWFTTVTGFVHHIHSLFAIFGFLDCMFVGYLIGTINSYESKE